MTETKLFLIDTNILVYAYEFEHSVRNDKAKKLLKDCFLNRKKLAVSSQNLAEFANMITKKGKLGVAQTKASIDDILSFDSFIKINYSAETIVAAIGISHDFKMPFWDSLLAATMKENGIFSVYTENIKDFKVPWLNAVNPLI